MNSKKSAKSYYAFCNLCYLATKKSILSDHKCSVVEEMVQNGMPKEEAAKLLQHAKEAALLFEKYRNKHVIIKSRSLLRHLKKMRHGRKVRSCCKHAAIETARYCGCFVAKSERPSDQTEEVQWFQPKKSKTDPIVKPEHNLAFVGEPPAGCGRTFLGSVLESNELVDSDLDFSDASSDDEESSISSGTDDDDDEAQQQQPRQVFLTPTKQWLLQFAAQQRPPISPISDCDESIGQSSQSQADLCCPEEVDVVSQRIAVEASEHSQKTTTTTTTTVRFLEASDAQLFALYTSQDYPVEVYQYSTGEGRGIRTTRDIDAGEVLADYHGEQPIMTAVEYERLQQRDPSNEQLRNIYKLDFEYAGKKYAIDASADPPAGKQSFGRLINFGRQPHHANCKLHAKMLYNVGGGNQQQQQQQQQFMAVFVVADRPIPKGHQLLWQYSLPQNFDDAFVLVANCRCEACKKKWKDPTWRITGKPIVERRRR